MKTIRFLILFTGILSMIFVSSCKKDKDTNPNNDAPAYQMQKVDIPEAMAQSNDPGAKQAVYYLNMVNAFSRYNSMMTPPPWMVWSAVLSCITLFLLRLNWIKTKQKVHLPFTILRKWALSS